MTKYPIPTMNQTHLLSYLIICQPSEFLARLFRPLGIGSRSSTSHLKPRRIVDSTYEKRPRTLSNWRNHICIATQWVAVAIMGFLAFGCQSAGPVSVLTQTDRLMATYPDLKSGKFALIADFESPAHMELVQLMGVSQNARSVRNTTAGRTETGGACLSFTSGSAHDTLMLSNNFASQWYLRRDWRPYDLLLMAVESPQNDLTLDLTILAGAKNNQLATGMKERLRSGWNLLRIDLAELGEQIPLDDIRELKLAVSGADKPVQINIDDIILTSSRNYLLGHANSDTDKHGETGDIGNNGSLYVQRRGRRWHIGADDRFELVFANGQIVGWYNTEVDPYKLNNLVRNTVLGPTPIRLDQQGEPIDMEHEMEHEQRRSVSAHQRILEMSPVRIVLQANWTFTREQGQSLPDNPRYVWTYTIYPTGQVFVDVVVSMPIADPPGSRIGLAVSLASEDANTWIEPLPAPSSGVSGSGFAKEERPKDRRIKPGEIKPEKTLNTTSEKPNTFAFARSAKANALILFAPSVLSTASSSTSSTTSSSTGTIHSRFDRTKKLRRWVYSTNLSPHSPTHFQCQIFVSTSTKHNDDELRLRANRSQLPNLKSLEVGTLALTDTHQAPMDSGHNNGTIDVTPDSGTVRLILDNTDRQFFTPCIRVHDRTNRKAWVYIDHLIYKNIARESDGYLVFQLPMLARRKTAVEVLFQQ